MYGWRTINPVLIWRLLRNDQAQLKELIRREGERPDLTEQRGTEQRGTEQRGTGQQPDQGGGERDGGRRGASH